MRNVVEWVWSVGVVVVVVVAVLVAALWIDGSVRWGGGRVEPHDFSPAFEQEFEEEQQEQRLAEERDGR